MSDGVKGQRSGVNIEDYERQLYASSTPGHAVEDPLAELSRLVGKADPFGSVFAHSASGGRSERKQAPQVAPAPLTPPISRLSSRPETPVRPSPATVQPHAGISVGGGLFSESDKSPNSNFSLRGEPSFPHHAAAVPDNESAFSPNFFDRTPSSPATDRDESEFYSYLSDKSEVAPQADYLQSQEIKSSAQPRTGRMVLVGILILGAIGIGAVLGWRGLDKKSADGSVPVIKAAQTPVKVEPVISDADKAKLDEEAAAAKVTTKEEQPVEVVTPPGSPPIKIARMIPLSGSQARPGDAPPQEANAGTPGPANGFPEPHSVKTISVRPDGSVIGADKSAAAPHGQAGQAGNVKVANTASVPQPEDAAPASKVPLPQGRPNVPQAAAPSRTPVAASAPDLIAKTIKTTTPKTTTRAMPGAGLPPQDNNAPLQLTPVEPAAPVAAAPVKVASAAPVQPAEPAAAAAGDGFAVQLGIAASEDEAKALSSKLSSQYGSVLGAYRPSVRKSEANGKTIYRVRIVNLAKDDATSLCEKLHGAGGQCFVAH